MTAYVAMLRAVNVGGRKLIMTELKAVAEELGLSSPRTFIASGNLLFSSDEAETVLRERLEARLRDHMAAEVPVMLRSADELAGVVAANPFARDPGNKVAAIFLNAAPAADTIDQAKNVAGERIALGRREIYVSYPDGMGRSKLRIPAAAPGTARNMNTVARLAELAREME